MATTMKSILRDKIPFTRTVEVAKERIEDILVSAFEGGCGYWLTILSTDMIKESKKFDGELNLIKMLMMGATIPIRDAENTKEVLGELNVFKVTQAIQAITDGKDLKGKENEHYKFHADNFFNENDDAETADVIIQIATMGEIVFG
jgi:hypothetical protein